MPRSGRGVETAVATCVAAALCAAVWLLDDAGRGPERRPPPRPPAAQSRPTSPADQRAARGADSSPALSPLSASARPLRVRIPRIGVDAPLAPLGLAGDGSLEPPPVAETALAGWYADGTPPGAVGTALVTGHVDNPAGPAVFYGLGSLRRGATVAVDRDDGLTAVFTVAAVEVHAGSDFPDRRVYGAARRPEIRLITCGGGYDEQSRSYLGNVVVYAHLTSVRTS